MIFIFSNCGFSIIDLTTLHSLVDFNSIAHQAESIFNNELAVDTGKHAIKRHTRAKTSLYTDVPRLITTQLMC